MLENPPYKGFTNLCHREGDKGAELLKKMWEQTQQEKVWRTSKI